MQNQLQLNQRYDGDGNVEEVMPWEEGYRVPVPDTLCKRCAFYRPPTQFNVRKNGERTVNCTACCDYNRIQERARRTAEKEAKRVKYDEQDEGVDDAEGDGCLDIEWHQLYDILARMESPGEGEMCQWRIVFDADADAFTDIEEPECHEYDSPASLQFRSTRSGLFPFMSVLDYQSFTRS
jgi:hypothetical protein